MSKKPTVFTAAGGTGASAKPTQAEKDELESLRVKYFNAKNSGSADVETAREAYQDYALKLMVDLSGKEDPPSADQEPPAETTGGRPATEEGYVKEGGWQADTDPNNWDVVPMRDLPDRYKVVDKNSKNVATDFPTIASAAKYIASAKEQGPAKPSGGGGTGESASAGGTDSLGIRQIKASAQGGRFETGFKLEGKERHYRSGKPSEYSCEYTLDSKTPIENVEVTIYQKINGFKTNEPDTISLKLGGPPHENGACCWMIPDFMTDGSARKTMETEYPHPNNHPVNPPPLTKIGGSIVGKWFGYKGISQQTKDGKRHVESWIHFPVNDINNIKGEQDKWRKYINIDITDKRFFRASGSLTTSRLDGVKEGSLPDYKYASVREITQAMGT